MVYVRYKNISERGGRVSEHLPYVKIADAHSGDRIFIRLNRRVKIEPETPNKSQRCKNFGRHFDRFMRCLEILVA